MLPRWPCQEGLEAQLQRVGSADSLTLSLLQGLPQLQRAVSPVVTPCPGLPVSHLVAEGGRGHKDPARQVSQAECASWVGLANAWSGLQCSFTSSSSPTFSLLISQRLVSNKYFVPQTQFLESVSCNTELKEAQTGADFSEVS